MFKSFCYFLVVTMFASIKMSGQISNDNPPVTPPTPETYSFTKYGDLPVGHFTGTFRTDIPIYQVRSGKLTHNISLSYSTNGVKVDEISSREGTGWALNVGGVITRSVNGKPDEISTRMLWPWSTSDPCDTCWDFWNYIKTFGLSTSADLEPDEFFYKTEGLSGKFMYDRNNEWKQFRYTGVKISGNMGTTMEFILTATDGTKYFFDVPELSRQYSINDENVPDFRPNTWYLRKILSLDGDSIKFNYTKIFSNSPTVNVHYLTGITQNLNTIIPIVGGSVYAYYGVNGGFMSGNGCSDSYPIVSKLNKNEVGAMYLASIDFKDGKVQFSYSGRDDAPDEKKLDSIKVIRTADNKLMKQFSLSHFYSEFAGTDAHGGTFYTTYSDLKKRLFLDTLFEHSVDSSESLHYAFEYDSANYLAPRLSFSQDKYGYANGKSNTLFFPNDTWLDDLLGYSHYGGDRSYNFFSARKGTLKKITYPTGGYSVVEYEPNRLNDTGKFGIQKDTIYAEMNPVTYSNQIVETDTFYNNDRVITGRVSCDWVTGPPEFFPDAYYIDFSIINVATNTCVFSCNVPIVPGNAISLGGLHQVIPTGATYKIKVLATNPDIIAKVSLHREWQIWDTVSYTNGIGGIRVKSISDFSSDNSIANRREFLYTAWGDSSGNSGTGVNDFSHIWVSASRRTGTVQLVSTSENQAYCGYNTIHSSSTFGLYKTDQSLVVYPKVIEINEYNGKNYGGTEYEFLIDSLRLNQFARPLSYSNPTHVWSFSPVAIIGAASSNSDFLTGHLKKTRTFTYVTKHGSREILTETDNYYSIDTTNYVIDSFYVVNKILDRSAWGNSWYSSSWKLFYDYDINKYFRHYGWSHLDSTVTKTFQRGSSNQFMTNKSYYKYSTNNFQVKEQKTLNSKGEEIEVITKYPYDLSNSNIYTSMVAENLINHSIETVTKKSGSIVLKRDSLQFQTFGANYLPSVINTAYSSGTLRTKIQFQQYDSKGNLTQYTPDDGITRAFIWDYNSTYPVAEIINSNSASIAFTSFEDANYGGWSFSGSTSNSYSVTGTRCYNPSGFSISKSGLSNATYIISYWGRTGNVTVNSTGPTRTGKTIGSWTYYEHEVTGTSITVSGSNYIDELRLYPKGAFMTTYTYSPLIGMTSQCDANNRIIYYEYDSFNRLKLLRDEDGRILKRMDYKFQATYQQ